MYEGKCFSVLPFMTYDGSNAAAIFSTGSDGQQGTWTYNEDNDILTIRCTYDVDVYEEWAAPVDGVFLLRPSGGIAQGLTPEEFTASYAVVAETWNEPVSNSMGIDDVPTLGANATATVDVELKPAMPNTNYNVAAVVTGGLNVLGNLDILSSTVTDESHVSVVVKNTGLLSLGGGKVLVHAVSN